MTLLRTVPISIPLSKPPKATLRLRFLREGETSSSEKVARVYRDWDSTHKVEMVFQADAGNGEWSRPVIIDQATALAQGEWLVTAVDQVPPRRTRALYMSFTESADITFDITHGAGGGGGGVPAVLPARVRVDKQPAAREVVVVERLPSGEWRVAGNLTTAEGDIELRVQGGLCYAMAIDEFGVLYEPNLAVSVGQTVRPTNFVGWLYRITEAGTLPAIEPEWWPVLGDNAPRLLGTARAEAVRYYRPQAFGPEPVEIL